MKSPVFAALVLSASLAMTASAQVKSVAAANNQPASEPAPNVAEGNATRARVLAPDTGVVTEKMSRVTMLAVPVRSEFNNHSEAGRARRAEIASARVSDSTTTTSSDTLPEGASIGQSSLKPGEATNISASLPQNVAASAAIASASTQVYRVGVGDVLDIQLSGNPARNSTLFTILENGVLEYPLAGNPIVVSGMTAPDIAALLRQRIKVFESPTVAVAVREYASHAVTISGFVAAPGTKILRREAVPLFALLAEALVLPEAARATITRKGVMPIVVDIKDENMSATLVITGDAIKVSGMLPPVTDFYFAGGEINSPGQKPYHDGITLTQAILASGGMKATAGSKVKISRQGADGKLTTGEFNLRKIQIGKDPDPLLQTGDRIEVTNAK